jgi:hypothetical protein
MVQQKIVSKYDENRLGMMRTHQAVGCKGRVALQINKIVN